MIIVILRIAFRNRKRLEFLVSSSGHTKMLRRYAHTTHTHTYIDESAKALQTDSSLDVIPNREKKKEKIIAQKAVSWWKLVSIYQFIIKVLTYLYLHIVDHFFIFRFSEIN